MKDADYGELVVKYGGLDAMATELGKHASNLERTISDIKTAVTQAAAGWEGDAHTTYRDVQQQWDKDAQAIKDALQAIGRVVHDAGGHYHGGDKKAAQYFL
jgi:WXG100 family type VII secretion target